MRDWIGKLLAELKAGQNIESYLVIAVALSIAIMDMLNLSEQSWVSEATLAVLALLAYSRIQLGRILREVIALLKANKTVSLFERNTQVDVQQVGRRMESARTIDWVAFTNQKTISIYRSYIMKCLARGGKIRILLMNPNDGAPTLLAKNSYAKSNGVDKFYVSGVEYTVDLCESLNKEISQGSIEVRFLASYPPYRMTIYNRDSNNGFVRIHLPKAPTSADAATIAWYRENNPEWFQFFVEQYELLWKNSTPAIPGYNSKSEIQ